MIIIREFLKPSFFIVLIVTFSQVLGCSSSQQTNSETAQIKNKPINSASDNSENANNSNIIATENFAKDWKNKFEATVTELEQNRRLWQENMILNYDFVIAKYVGGMTNEWNRSPVLVKIRNGVKTSIEVESKSDKSIMARTDGFENFDTIDKLFDYIKQRLNDGNIIDIKYDKKFGYPKSVFMTFTYSTNHNYQTIQISKFEAVK